MLGCLHDVFSMGQYGGRGMPVMSMVTGSFARSMACLRSMAWWEWSSWLVM